MFNIILIQNNIFIVLAKLKYINNYKICLNFFYWIKTLRLRSMNISPCQGSSVPQISVHFNDTLFESMLFHNEIISICSIIFIWTSSPCCGQLLYPWWKNIEDDLHNYTSFLLRSETLGLAKDVP